MAPHFTEGKLRLTDLKEPVPEEALVLRLEARFPEPLSSMAPN